MYNVPGTITKGRYMSAVEVGTIIGLNQDVDEDAFRLATLKLKRQIEKASPVIAKSSDGGLQILTDVQGSDYVHKRFTGGIKRLRRLRETMQTRVDAANLSEAEIGVHAGRLDTEHTVVLAIDTAIAPKTVQVRA